MADDDFEFEGLLDLLAARRAEDLLWGCCNIPA